MLGLVQNWFGPRCNPIGVDFGSDCLRLAQVQWVDGDWKLLAAASADVPGTARNDPAFRSSFFTQTVRDLMISGGFQGRSAVLGLRACDTYIQHLRMGRLDEEETKKALKWEARGKLPFDPGAAVLRHIVAGEVYVDQEPKQEVILLAVKNETVTEMLQAAAKAKLDVVGMNVEPVAVVDCFTQVYRRQSEAKTTSFYVDIGLSGTRAVLARGRQILFARSIPLGGETFAAAVAEELKVTPDVARAMRVEACETARQNAADRAQLNSREPPKGPSSQQQQMEQACQKSLEKLAAELDMCRRYYEATFPAAPVDKLVFIGGESRHRWLCQTIAQKLGLAAQLGDPVCRMGKTCQVGPESGIDRRQPQPAWGVAIGLSMGSPSATSAAEARSQDERVQSN